MGLTVRDVIQLPIMETANQFLDMIERRIYELLPGIVLSWGIATHKDGHYCFYDSYREASTALEIGMRQKTLGERTFFSNTRIQVGIKKLNMELGSNSPVIVLNDANLDEAVAANVSGAFSAVGQNCIGVQRIFVEQEQYEQLFVLIWMIKFKKLTTMAPLELDKFQLKIVRFVYLSKIS